MSLSKLEIRLIASGAVFAVGLVLCYGIDADAWIQLVVLGASYLVVGYDVLWKAARNIAKGDFLDENFLMAVATIGAFAIGMYPEAAAVMLFFQVGEWFEDRAVDRTRTSIADLMDIQPESARVVRDGSVVVVDPEEVRVGETIEILPGERIPLDGTVLRGSSSLDTKALTGESAPRDVGPGDQVVSGTVNLSSVISVEVSKTYVDSTVSKVLELVEESAVRKARAERFITRFARYYTPIVVAAAVVVAVVPTLLGQDFVTWLYRALTFLVVSCPCALVISVPLGFYCGIGAASRMGVLVKGATYLEALSKVHTVVFDKTGTLTEGRFAVTEVHAVDGDADALVEIAAEAESVSNHPISLSLREYCGSSYDPGRVSEAEELPGKGVRAVVGGEEVLVGNPRLMADMGIECDDSECAGTRVHVARGGRYLGSIVVSDTVKADSADAVSQLKARGAERTVMLSGDSEAVCRDVAARVGVDEHTGGLLPGGKTAELERLMSECPEGRTVVFVGDGINDAPSLARADVGVAMGGLGSDAAVEAADVVVMDDSLPKIASCIGLSRKVNSIVRANIVFALAVKFLIMVLTLLGISDMWLAVFGDVGVTVIAVLNAMRCMRT